MSSPAPSIYHPDTIQVDSDDADYDNYYNGGITSTAASLASQVTDYRFENGRRYHAYHAGSYWAPNDEQASDQEELFHHVYLLRLNGALYLAPIDQDGPPEQILDIGTGYGNWCLDMAPLFPDATITGNDLSPIQPRYVPPNVNFEVDDFNDEWLFGESKFDFVHGRALYGSVKDWNLLLERVLKVLKPGGWWESVETKVEILCDDDSVPADAALLEWLKVMWRACEDSGTTFNVAGNMKGWCEKAGFTEVTEKVFKLPIGPWPRDKHEKTVGSFNLANMRNACEGFSLYLLSRFGNMTIDEINELISRVKEEMGNKRVHAYFRLYVTPSLGQASADFLISSGSFCAGFFCEFADKEVSFMTVTSATPANPSRRSLDRQAGTQLTDPKAISHTPGATLIYIAVQSLQMPRGINGFNISGTVIGGGLSGTSLPLE
ncbi:hypothetical protein DRE_03275 [Drechslerella stenobrocha 248]|uniref:Methyltransferase domain-containing protein n=1 Tax=Drechslerella stenobrocha 248 TaxID=1043628 RepID=W7IF24_9PEZI|nr:hypothetical protein DRE_03275 [Drechslerella stenobrocha 248]